MQKSKKRHSPNPRLRVNQLRRYVYVPDSPQARRSIAGCDPQSQKSARHNISIVSAGELFPSGMTMELVRDATRPNKLNFLVWDGTNARIEPRVEHEDMVYVPPTFDPTILQALRLPVRCAPYGSTRQLLGDTCKFLWSGPGLVEEPVLQLAYFALSTWFVDCLPTAPSVSLVGPAASEATAVLRRLACVCRHPLLLAEVSHAGFCSLPMHLCPTLLINQPGLSPKMQQFLRASSSRDFWVPRGNRLLNFCSAKAIYSGDAFMGTSLSGTAIRISITPTREQLSVNQRLQEQIANELQAKLLMYRLANYQKVRDSVFDVLQFTSPLRDIARSLGACVVDDPELQSSIVPLLQDEDEESRAGRWGDLSCVAIEALLFFCHEGPRESVYVREVADTMNAILKGRGETLELEDRAVGDKLRSLGLPTKPRDSKGYKVMLLDGVRSQIHRLARELDVPSLQDGVVRCRHCSQTGHHSQTEGAERPWQLTHE